MDFRKVKLLNVSLLGLAISSLAACSGGGGENNGGSPNIPPDAGTDTGTDINTDNTAGALNFSQAAYSVSEAEGSIVITVNRQGDSIEPASVDFNVTGLTATEGEDFVEVSGTLEWAASDSTPKTFTIEVEIDPLSAEQEETVNLSLSSPTGTSLGELSTASLTISNTPCTEVNSLSISESITFSDACYIVERNMLVKNAATLTISPNVHMFFTSGTLLEIDPDGTLHAVGTADQPIVFTGEVKAPGYWDGIEVASLATSQINHAIVEYGGSSSSFIKANIGVISSGKLSVQNTISRYSAGNGVMNSGANSRITAFSGNTITLNEKAPIALAVNHIGDLDSGSSYTGNLTVSGQTQDFIEVFGNRVDAQQVWKKLNVPYRMPGTRVDVYSELTIEAGTRLEFLSDGQLSFPEEGTLKAIGTEVSPIVFTGLEPSRGYWRGIQFSFNNNANEMDYTVVEYGGGPGSNSLANVGVFGQDGRLSIKNSVLQYSAKYGFSFGSGITLGMSGLMVTENAITGHMSFNDAGKLSGNSSYSGNTDDRVILFRDIVGMPDQTIKNIDIPYLIGDDIQIPVAKALMVEAGTEMQFAAGGGFNIQQTGSLTAQGTAEKPIIFTGAQKVKGYWNGIQFTFSNSPANIIEHAVIEYGGEDSGNTSALVGLFGSTGLPTRLSLTNTTMRGSLTNGIELSTGSTVNFSGNSFFDIDGQEILDPR